jgi:hypothetical protein
MNLMDSKKSVIVYGNNLTYICESIPTDLQITNVRMTSEVKKTEIVMKLEGCYQFNSLDDFIFKNYLKNIQSLSINAFFDLYVVLDINIFTNFASINKYTINHTPVITPLRGELSETYLKQFRYFFPFDVLNNIIVNDQLNRHFASCIIKPSELLNYLITANNEGLYL